MVAGQLVALVLPDHFGLNGDNVRSCNGWRVLGCLLLVAAVIVQAHRTSGDGSDVEFGTKIGMIPDNVDICPATRKIAG